MYCVNSQARGAVSIIEGMKSTVIPVGAAGSTHLSVLPTSNGTSIFVANFGEGSVSSILYKNGRVTSLFEDTISLRYKSGSTGLQAKPHAHMVLWIGGPRIMVPDLGSDRLWTYIVGYNSQLHNRQYFKMRQGYEPRHDATG